LKLVARLPRAELAEGQLVRVSYPPYDVLVTFVAGEPFAIEDACNHAGASLCEGSIEGERVMCPMHGYVFSVRTGELLAPEGLCEGQRTFVARVEGDAVAIYDPFTLTVTLR
jgi:nitrite reductase/ring-hydroxylating ferredoxin subunit